MYVESGISDRLPACWFYSCLVFCTSSNLGLNKSDWYNNRKDAGSILNFSVSNEDFIIGGLFPVVLLVLQIPTFLKVNYLLGAQDAIKIDVVCLCHISSDIFWSNGKLHMTSMTYMTYVNMVSKDPLGQDYYVYLFCNLNRKNT